MDCLAVSKQTNSQPKSFFDIHSTLYYHKVALFSKPKHSEKITIPRVDSDCHVRHIHTLIRESILHWAIRKHY